MKKKYVLRVGGLTYICGCRCRQNAHWAVPVEVRSEHPTGLLAQNRLSQGSKTVRRECAELVGRKMAVLSRGSGVTGQARRDLEPPPERQISLAGFNTISGARAPTASDVEGPAEKEVEACPPMKITPPSSTDSIIVPEQATPTGGVSNGGVDAEISSLSLKPASQRRSSLRANERDESVSLDEHDMIVTGVGLGQEASDQRQGDKEAATETLSPAEATPAPSTTITKTAEELIGMEIGVPEGIEIIDWPAAIEQCAGDISFLEELLVDLWNESKTHVKQLRECVPKGDMLNSQHKAHSIKGAAANLMCNRLCASALYLEKGGFIGTNLQAGGADWVTVKEAMEVSMGMLEEEMVRFESFLKEKQLF